MTMSWIEKFSLTAVDINTRAKRLSMKIIGNTRLERRSVRRPVKTSPYLS